ncbi:MAG: VWA domain-containing protein [Deltaproteobacteria bacterium]|nr:VWA domain-containing protein [Deltaproteobacteria bacterium]
MRRSDIRKDIRGPVIGPAEEAGVSSLFSGKQNFSFALNKMFPWVMFIMFTGMTAWFVHIGLNKYTNPVVFTRKWALWGLTVLPLIAWYVISRDHRRYASLNYSRLGLLSSIKPGLRTYFRFLTPTVKIISLGLLIFALSGPSLVNIYEETDEQGIDIVIALDVSRSMEANDMPPNRLVAAKDVVSQFVKSRPNDRMGLVVFGMYAYPYCPLTLDHYAFNHLLSRVNLGTIDEGRATAIGEALGTSLNMLRRSKSKTRIIILLTDGDNNAGEMSPKEAAQHATALGVKIHTILMGDPNGGNGSRLSLFTRRAPVNPKLLEQISSRTGGSSYLASDKAALQDRFQKLLDKLEKNKYITKYRTNRGIQSIFIMAAMLLLFLGSILEMTWLRRFP